MIRVARNIVLLAGVLLTSQAAFASPPPPVPGVISMPDYRDSFTLFAQPRREPHSLGNVTRDGYPVMPSRNGGFHYIVQPGSPLPGPLFVPSLTLPYTGEAGVSGKTN